MKPTIFKLGFFLFFGNLLLISCRKPDDLVKPVPQTPPPVLSHSFQLTIDSIPDEPVASINNLFALVTLVNAQNEAVLTNKKLAISFNGKFKTPELELPAGNYRLTKFLLINESNKVRFVSPIENSAKANTVSKPISTPAAFIPPLDTIKKKSRGVMGIKDADYRITPVKNDSTK